MHNTHEHTVKDESFKNKDMLKSRLDGMEINEIVPLKTKMTVCYLIQITYNRFYHPAIVYLLHPESKKRKSSEKH